LEDEIQFKPGYLSTKWAPGMILAAMGQIDCYQGLEGEAQEDEGWKQRKKTVTL
jgi:hypothetical protein